MRTTMPHSDVGKILVSMLLLFFLLQLSLFAPISMANNKKNNQLLLRGEQQRSLQFDLEAELVEAPAQPCAPGEATSVTRDGTECVKVNATSGVITSSTGNGSATSNSSSSHLHTCLDLAGSGVIDPEGAPSGFASCFNLTVFGWDEGQLPPWDPWAGFVCVDMPQRETLEVTYETATYWGIWDAAVWVGSNLTQVPTSKNSHAVEISAFPYQQTSVNGQRNLTFTVPLDSQVACGQGDSYTLHVAAYAFVAEPTGNNASQYIWNTQYPAWGQTINNNNNTILEDEDASFLYFDVPILCRCS